MGEDLVTPPYSAEIATAVALVTETVLTGNVALVLPFPTVTEDGTLATDVLPLDSDTTAPPLGAGPFSVTVPVETFPPTTEDGLSDRETSARGGGFTVMGEDLATPPYNAEIVTAAVLDTETVVTGNVALVLPLPTVTED